MLLALWQSSTAFLRSPPFLSCLYVASAFSRHSWSSLPAAVPGSSANAGPAKAKSMPPARRAAASNLRMRIARPSFRGRPGPAPSRRPGGSDELEDETDEGEGLGERDAEEHCGAHLAGHLRLTGHCLDRLTDEVTDTDAGADGGEAVPHRTEAGLESVRLRHCQAHELAHWCLPCIGVDVEVCGVANMNPRGSG